MARRRNISTTISDDRALDRVAQVYGDFAALLYTWAIPHATDDRRLPGEPDDLLYLVVPRRRDKTPEDVEHAIRGWVREGLVDWVWVGKERCIFLKAESFYRYQDKIPQQRRLLALPDGAVPVDVDGAPVQQAVAAPNAVSAQRAAPAPKQQAEGPEDGQQREEPEEPDGPEEQEGAEEEEAAAEAPQETAAAAVCGEIAATAAVCGDPRFRDSSLCPPPGGPLAPSGGPLPPPGALGITPSAYTAPPQPAGRRAAADDHTGPPGSQPPDNGPPEAVAPPPPPPRRARVGPSTAASELRELAVQAYDRAQAVGWTPADAKWVSAAIGRLRRLSPEARSQVPDAVEWAARPDADGAVRTWLGRCELVPLVEAWRRRNGHPPSRASPQGLADVDRSAEVAELLRGGQDGAGFEHPVRPGG